MQLTVTLPEPHYLMLDAILERLGSKHIVDEADTGVHLVVQFAIRELYRRLYPKGHWSDTVELLGGTVWERAAINEEFGQCVPSDHTNKKP